MTILSQCTTSTKETEYLTLLAFRVTKTLSGSVRRLRFPVFNHIKENIYCCSVLKNSKTCVKRPLKNRQNEDLKEK